MPLPVTEGHFVAFVGWLWYQRELGARKVSDVSIIQYLSAVAQVHVIYTGTVLPSAGLLVC